MEVRTVALNYIHSLMESGTLGRMGQVIYCLSREKDSGFNVNRSKWKQLSLNQKIKKYSVDKKSWETVYRQIRIQYNEIRIYKLWSTRIGEYVPRYLEAVKDSKIDAQKGILDVFVLSDCINHNSRLSTIIGRNIKIIDDNNVDMWIYILCHFPKVEFNKYWDAYKSRTKMEFFSPENTVNYFNLTDNEEKEIIYNKKIMNLNKPYVCIFSKDMGYLSSLVGTNGCNSYKYQSARDSDVNKMGLAADYLAEKEIITVRMGRAVKDSINFSNCINYASEYYNELMDIALFRDCRFMLGDTNGLCIFSLALNVPAALKNAFIDFWDTWGGHPQNPQNILIFKKYYKRSENRFLSLEEMLNFEAKVDLIHNGVRLYRKAGIEVVENTSEEILDLVIEMNARIDGEWVETQEDIELQEKYRTIFKKWCMKMNFNENAVYKGRIGALFLRKNKYLLEC